MSMNQSVTYVSELDPQKALHGTGLKLQSDRNGFVFRMFNK